MAGDESSQYKVSISPNELRKLHAWGEWANQNNVLDNYLAALKTVNYRLSFEPEEWGEPRYTLRKLELEVRFGTEKMLNVWYGVSRKKHVVYVKLFPFRRDYPPGQPPEEL